MATTGGNPLQRTRCVYFQDVTTPCNKRLPGAGCSATGGATRGHAILGASEHCTATHPTDMAVALAALDAPVSVLGIAGERTTRSSTCTGRPATTRPATPCWTTSSSSCQSTYPRLPMAARSAYRKVRDPASYAFALVSVVAALDVADGVVRDARIALGGVAHKPWRAYRAEAALRGATVSQDAFRAAA
jgi:xanthine dehydrogenase YagS FAD-binding subunit